MLIHPKLIAKVRRLSATYKDLIYEPLGVLEMRMLETEEHLRSVPEDWKNWPLVAKGATWGAPGGTAWFATEAVLPETFSGKTLYLRANTGGRETLLWINGEPKGIFTHPVESPQHGHHHTRLLTPKATSGERIEIALESYAGHHIVGTQPFETKETQDAYPMQYPKTFGSVELVSRRDDVMHFVFDLETLVQLVDFLPSNSFRRAKVCHALEKLFAETIQDPENASESMWRLALARARNIMAPLLDMKNSPSAPSSGLIGHSHIDTAWLWTIKETIRKCARTFSNTLALMEEYPEFTFIQSTPFHADLMRKHYPQIWKGIIRRVCEGRWEPNGGMWIECDCNITSGESMVRQFLKGQRFTQKHFGFRADTFWLPDTFGYSAAIPQILRGCGIRYFLTTKLLVNDTNNFPYDTFIWRGIDGSEVLTHFNQIHCWPDAGTLISRVQGEEGKDARTQNAIQHKEVNDRRLISYGFGDGGGGPQFEMIEMARRCVDLEGCPNSKHTTVSQFMQELANNSRPPVHVGELYFESHRGTLTQMHEIKRGNRRSEIALRNAEFFSVRARLAGRPTRKEKIDDLYALLLVNQFHDILPGTSIPEVHDQAIRELNQVERQAQIFADELSSDSISSGNSIMVWNTLSWERSGTMALSNFPSGQFPSAELLRSQEIQDLDGERIVIVQGLILPPLSGTAICFEPISTKAESPFSYNVTTLETPCLSVQFDDHGYIVSLIDKARDRELRGKGLPLNVFLTGEDVPESWDNWDIDADQKLKMIPQHTLESREVVADGPLQFRVRSEYRLGEHSRLRQDMVFFSDSPQIDFETIVDWHGRHQLLKVGFDLSVSAPCAKHEVQFGHLERPTHQNTSVDRARFEVSQHKWTDLSENRYGVALLNDCKYGISILDNDLRLTLLKGGCHPDPRGDEGIRKFTYSLRPHIGGFSVENVVRPAYELNIPVLISRNNPSSRSEPLLEIDASNIILEATKIAEDQNGLIFRFYEAERSAVKARIHFNFTVKQVFLTNLLEEIESQLPHNSHSVELEFHPFEIRTLKIIL
jgi:alpha-mannosidase